MVIDRKLYDAIVEKRKKLDVSLLNSDEGETSDMDEDKWHRSYWQGIL